MSYRRSDAGGYAGWLRRELTAHFPGEGVFRDIDSLHGGERWTERLDLTLARCDAILAVIGPDWVTATNEKGRRLDDPNDRVRLELEAGIRRGVPIVPALVGGARMPGEEDLPESLVPLHEWQALRLRDDSWDHDVERLVGDLKRACEAVPGELQLGAKFAGHSIEEVIGRGGMGVVYRAHHPGLNRDDAIKVITPALARDRRFRDRFVRESHLAASIKHPHVVSVYDAGEENGLLYLTMEFIEGRDLRTLLAHEGPLSPESAAEVVVEVCDALQAAHEHGLIHRDVKPGNILIEDRNGKRRVYLGDFGLAREKTTSTGLTSSGQWYGTADYVSPEQVMGEPVGPHSDVYALGCVLFEMLSGRVPFPGHSETAKLVAHATKEPPPLRQLRPELPPAFEETVRTAMARDPTIRFATVAQFRESIEDAIRPQKGVIRKDETRLTGPTEPMPEPEQPGGDHQRAESDTQEEMAARRTASAEIDRAAKQEQAENGPVERERLEQENVVPHQREPAAREVAERDEAARKAEVEQGQQAQREAAAREPAQRDEASRKAEVEQRQQAQREAAARKQPQREEGKRDARPRSASGRLRLWLGRSRARRLAAVALPPAMIAAGISVVVVRTNAPHVSTIEAAGHTFVPSRMTRLAEGGNVYILDLEDIHVTHDSDLGWTAGDSCIASAMPTNIRIALSQKVGSAYSANGNGFVYNARTNQSSGTHKVKAGTYGLQVLGKCNWTLRIVPG